ncbi:MAG: helix-turn-helix transcriptional regulator [Enterococcus sp.]|nr:helix-turn-helix transcriptional regulator [Enterococcus sp.]
MLTALGKYLRKLRIDKEETLKEMADKLNVSSPFLSELENGKKKIPTEFGTKLSKVYKFTTSMNRELQDAIAESNEFVELNFKNKSNARKDLAITFAREFDNLDSKSINEINKILNSRKRDFE